MTQLNSIHEGVEVNLLLDEKNYWSRKINEDFRKTIIPYKNTNSEIVRRDKHFIFSLTENASSEIIKLGKDSESRIFVVLSSCLVVLLSELNMNNKQIVIGMPIYNDIGNLNPVNSVIPLIINIEHANSFKDILNIVKNEIKEGLENHAYPINLMPNLLNLENNQDNAFPIFDITASLENIQNKDILDNFKTNIHFNFIKNQDSIDIDINYNSGLYDFKVIKQIGEIFSFLASELIKDIAKGISLIDIIPDNQKSEILDKFNNTYKEYNKEVTIIERFVSIAKEYPDRVALVFEDKSITYGFLDYCSSLLCYKLREKGIVNDVLIGLMCDRSIDHIIAILGIFKSGAGYLAIDPKTPYERINYMVKDSGVNLIVGHSKYLENISANTNLLDISNYSEWGNITNDELDCKQESVAYVLYTSGTTGFPKGVVTEQRNISAYCSSFLQEFKFQSNDIILQQASYAFDTFTEEVFPILLVGGRIVVVGYDLVRNIPELVKYIVKSSITIIDCSPLLINELGKLLPKLNSLNTVISGGDALKKTYLEKYSDKIKIHNTYGPTESTVCATFYRYEKDNSENIPIGYPISNYKVFILNDNLRLVPIGFKGEICIAGDGLSRGYLNNVELTAEKFILDPYTKNRIYRSGDLGEFGLDGAITFCGRKDNQLSLRGFRIELNEIENQILKYSGVTDAKVIPFEKDNEKWICAYVVSSSLSVDNELKEFLLTRLPEYMVPSFIIKIDEMPMNSNGKVATKSLPNPFKPKEGLVRFIENRIIQEAKEKLQSFPKKSKKEDILKITTHHISESEKNILLYEFNNTRYEYDREISIIELFERQVEKTPHRIAIAFYDEFYTYLQLSMCVNTITKKLIESGVCGNSVIGLLTQRSPIMMFGLLAILKTGSAFMPLEEEASDERSNYIISNTKPEIVLVDDKYSIKKLNVRTINLSTINFTIKTDETFKYNGSPYDVTHLLHTSGTTGVPKGVLLNNYSLINLFDYVAQLINLNEKDVVLSLTPSTFDVFNAESLLPLIKGAKVNIADTKGVLDTKAVLHLMRKGATTFFQCSPTVLQKLLKDEDSVKCFESVKYIISAGEPLLDSIKEKFSKIKNTQLFNLYGPSETTIYSTGKNVTGENTLNIGKPIYNTEIRILDRQDNLVPIKATGEIYIGGDGLARGYINQPELTHEVFRFIDNKRFYKTGDLASWLADGDIEFYGRIDHQVQIAGVRVELGEVENSFLADNDINEAAVIVKEDQEGPYLVAFLVSKKRINEQAIKVKLSQSLPLYMIPRYIVQLESMPYTSSRKIHRKLLESLDIPKEDTSGFELPKTDIEKKLLAIWADVLGIEANAISVGANFFTTGGHSLNAAILSGRIHQETETEFTLQDVFLYTTIKAQAKQLEIKDKKKLASITKAQEKVFYALSSAQKRLYILQQMDLNSVVYNMPYAISLGADIEIAKVESAFCQLISRHESLRTSIALHEGTPMQFVHDKVDFKLLEYSVEESEEANLRKGFIKPFDLSQAPLIRVAIVAIKGKGNLLLIDIHHIVSDGLSHIILEKEFLQLYLGENLAPLALQYKDYSEWQNSIEYQQKKKKQEEFWLKQFEGEIPVLKLPTDYERPVIQSSHGANVSFALNKEETHSIKLLAETNGLTLYMSVLSLFTMLISKLSGQDDIIIGSPTAGRNHPDLHRIVGMFVNTLSIRIKIHENDTLDEFLQRLKQTTLNSFENQDYQFEDLVEKISVHRDTSRNPLFDVAFNFMNQEEADVDISEIYGKKLVHTSGVSKFDLTLTAADYGEQLLLNFEYCTKLFKEETINRFVGYLKRIINQLTSGLKRRISSFEIISEEEKELLLHTFNINRADYPKNKTIIELFEEQVTKTPNKIAIVYADEQITYQELNRRSNQLGRYLIEKGILEENYVGVLYKTSPSVYIGIIAILKTGKAYLPIDTSLPESRIRHMIIDSGLKTLLGVDRTSRLNDRTVISIEALELENYQEENITLSGTSSLPAYLIYTSGSSGTPKGVVVDNKALVNLCFWHNKFYEIKAKDHLSKFAGFGFDASVWETFPGLIAGASLYILDDQVKLDPEEVNKYFNRHDITVSFLPTQFCEKFVNCDNKSLRILLTGGDKLKYFKKNNYKLYNNYGPTENTVVATNYEVEEFSHNIPIGKPLSNTQIYILDKANNVQPIGISGELCISGEGLSLGYLNNVELTLDKFVNHPFGEATKLYRTGDSARWLPNGNIEFLGRLDNQVKLRGYRIELGEIEVVLLAHDNIKECVVLLQEVNGDKILCGYVVTKEEYNEESIRNYLANRLPYYMVPTHFVSLERMPLTSNGKVNVKLLPHPEITVKEYVAPRNEVEETLVNIWSDVLGVQKDKIGIDSNFFDLGGHSLLIIKAVQKINKDTNYNLKVIDLFRYTTIRELTNHISNEDSFEITRNDRIDEINKGKNSMKQLLKKNKN